MRRDTVEQVGGLAYARGNRAGAAAAYQRLIASYTRPPADTEVGVHRAVLRLAAHHAASGDAEALRALATQVVTAYRAITTIRRVEERATLEDPAVMAGLAAVAELVPAARKVLVPDAPKPKAALKEKAPAPAAQLPPEEQLPEVDEAPDQFAHLELVEGSSSKFWRAVQRGGEVRTTFGRIGTRGQSKLKTFDDSDDADDHVRAMIDEKTGKGYEQIDLSELARRALARPTWTPVLEPGDAEATGSTIGGAPWIEAGAAWPTCDECGRTLGFILQLASADCPVDLGGGLIQLFLCGWCGPEAYALVRVVPKRPSTERAVREAGALAAGSLTPRAPMRITGWDGPEDDVPYGGDEDADRALAADPDLRAAIDAEDAADDLGTTAQGDKLGGWPYWHESVGALPRCPICGARHRLLVQLDFGRSRALPDFVGIAFIGNCAAHPEPLSLTWTT